MIQTCPQIRIVKTTDCLYSEGVTEEADSGAAYDAADITAGLNDTNDSRLDTTADITVDSVRDHT